MTEKSSDKKRARRIQKLTGWSYSECLRCVSMSDSAIAALILMRKQAVNEEKIIRASVKP